MAGDFMSALLGMLLVSMIYDYIQFKRGKSTPDTYSPRSICIGVIAALVISSIAALVLWSAAAGVGFWFGFILSDFFGRWFYHGQLIEKQGEKH